MMSLILGGSGSGKSEFAENYLLSHSVGQRIYLATMQVLDEESKDRVRRHRMLREGKQFFTIERATHLESLDLTGHLGGSCQDDCKYDIILECVSNLLANEMYAPDGRGTEEMLAGDTGEERFLSLLMDGIFHLSGQAGHLVVVGNDIFSDGRQYDPYSTRYMRLLGEFQRRIAACCDEVAVVVAGCPIYYTRTM